MVFTIFCIQTYDDTKNLEDVVGRYTNCRYAPGRDSGTFLVDNKFTQNGASIGALRDFYDGSEAHWRAIDRYLEDGMKHWITDQAYRSQVSCKYSTQNKVLVT